MFGSAHASLKLFGREIIFEEFQPVVTVPQRHRQTDRRTDDILTRQYVVRPSVCYVNVVRVGCKTEQYCHRRTGKFFLGGLGHLRPKNFLAAPEKIFGIARKNCYANLQNDFARLTPPSNC